MLVNDFNCEFYDFLTHKKSIETEWRKIKNKYKENILECLKSNESKELKRRSTEIHRRYFPGNVGQVRKFPDFLPNGLDLPKEKYLEYGITREISKKIIRYANPIDINYDARSGGGVFAENLFYVALLDYMGVKNAIITRINQILSQHYQVINSMDTLGINIEYPFQSYDQNEQIKILYLLSYIPDNTIVLEEVRRNGKEFMTKICDNAKQDYELLWKIMKENVVIFCEMLGINEQSKVKFNLNFGDYPLRCSHPDFIVDDKLVDFKFSKKRQLSLIRRQLLFYYLKGAYDSTLDVISPKTRLFSFNPRIGVLEEHGFDWVRYLNKEHKFV